MLSGGKDSTALALRLAEVEPREYEYVITPTGNELPEMLAHWKTISGLLGQPLKVLTCGKSLQRLIRDQRMIPNFRARWCTRILKIEVAEQYLCSVAPAVSYVGLRADEEARVGMYGEIEGVTKRYPLREWGWGLADVLHYLDSKGVTIPARTDCAWCFFQRIGEWWNLWRDHPAIFAQGEQIENEVGHTFRTPGKDSWPTSLTDLRLKFEAGDRPRHAGQINLLDERAGMCRACSM
jgi:3'-phosphoadenosine 5'-phosphosulfate sulfotransferase (PAPS reductase)/FAD synthetase